MDISETDYEGGDQTSPCGSDDDALEDYAPDTAKPVRLAGLGRLTVEECLVGAP